MSDQELSPRIGLALSGGGFRATLYHCGALIRLNEAGYLPNIDRITSVSGGSITSGLLARVWDRLAFGADGKAGNLEELLAQPLQEFCRLNLDVKTILDGLNPFGKSIVEKLIDAYDTHLFNGMTLNQLPERPDFIFMSTNLQTGRAFRFSRSRAADYMVGEITDVSQFRVAQAVAASSGFPPVLSPVKLTVSPGDWTDMPGTRFFGNPDYNTHLNLSDGGVYDNLGLERIDHFRTILCSDAGAPFKFGETFGTFSLKQVIRALDIATDQSRAQRKSHLFDLHSLTDRKVAYWGVDQPVSDDPPPHSLPHDPAVTEALAAIRTRLNRFSDREQGQLINWGYVSCDERFRKYVDTAAAPPAGLPRPDWPLTASA